MRAGCLLITGAQQRVRLMRITYIHLIQIQFRAVVPFWEAKPWRLFLQYQSLVAAGTLLCTRAAPRSFRRGRNGVQAWLKEGCMSWIPKSTPIWGTVSEKRYLRERSSSGSFVFLVESFCFEIYVKS